MIGDATKFFAEMRGKLRNQIPQNTDNLDQCVDLLIAMILVRDDGSTIWQINDFLLEDENSPIATISVDETQKLVDQIVSLGLSANLANYLYNPNPEIRDSCHEIRWKYGMLAD